MPTILIVEDSAADRGLIARLLAQDTELQAVFAVDGQQALAMMEDVQPDLVVTDLRMPRMDGLELVASIRKKHPFVPVILMTSRGSEDIAVQSLRSGASSYVPKRALAGDLVRTIRSVLELAGARRSRNRVLHSMVETRSSFVLENDYSLVSDLVSHLEDQLEQMGFGDDTECIRVSVALTEALSNAMYHGNLEMDSLLRERDFGAYLSLAARRAKRAPYQDRRIHVQARLSRYSAGFVVQDEGPGFDPASLPDPTEVPNLERVTGRGILLMRTLMDQVRYNSSGNRVRLLKRSRRAPRAARKSASGRTGP